MTIFNHPELTRQLAGHFQFFVERELNGGCEAFFKKPNVYTVELAEAGDYCVRYTARVKLPKMACADTIEVLQKLDMFCSNEEPPMLVNDLEFLLGDGDDSDAVWVEDGAVCMWLRHWPNGQ